MASILGIFNRLLPFATPGTPVLQDLIHLAALCGLLYYAPRIQEWLSSNSQGGTNPQRIPENENVNGEDQARRDIPVEPQAPADLRDGAALQVDDNDDAHGHQPVPEGEVEVEEGEAGPARRNPDILAPARNVGAKKAKSLARRDQRRAYHEFQRSQGEMQRARDAEGASEREIALAAERDRRRAAEAALEAKKAKEREKKREVERLEREADLRRRELAVELVQKSLAEKKMCDLFRIAQQLGKDVDEEWVEKILRSSGILDQQKNADTMTLITGTGWVVRVTAQDMAVAYQTILGEDGTSDGVITYDDFGKVLQGILATS